MGDVGQTPRPNRYVDSQRVAGRLECGGVRTGDGGEFCGDFQGSGHGEGVEGDLSAGAALHLDGFLALGEQFRFIFGTEHAELEVHRSSIIS